MEGAAADHHSSGQSGRGGVMAVVVGPSGAGKDTLMAIAAGHFSGDEQIMFARRVITRDAGAGGEDHDGVSEAEFAALERDGRFAVSWAAHGLHYGIPADTQDAVAQGRLVIANGSRSALAKFRAAYPSLIVINITARPEVLAARLEARGRESREDILRRLERSSLSVDGDYSVVTIDNSGAVDDAAQHMIAILSNCLRTPAI
jgi:ribose 1,5-bisphosphokinase